MRSLSPCIVCAEYEKKLSCHLRKISCSVLLLERIELGSDASELMFSTEKRPLHSLLLMHELVWLHDESVGVGLTNVKNGQRNRQTETNVETNTPHE